VTSVPGNRPANSGEGGEPGLQALARARADIAAAYRTPEPECVPPLIGEARTDARTADSIAKLAHELIVKVRSGRTHTFGVEALMKEF
jgi:RHH-type proline utilization regulon transcriptional repressor/proline dehydrogenase/delta 1-pyrroline-5-carboxylate dehydrogenase